LFNEELTRSASSAVCWASISGERDRHTAMTWSALPRICEYAREAARTTSTPTPRRSVTTPADFTDRSARTPNLSDAWPVHPDLAVEPPVDTDSLARPTALMAPLIGSLAAAIRPASPAASCP
jgi:hypothetical protein